METKLTSADLNCGVGARLRQAQMLVEGVDDAVLILVGSALCGGAVAFVHLLRRYVLDRGHFIQPARIRAGQSAVDVCAICLDSPSLATETLCGHVFCTDCFMSHWRAATGGIRPARCPLCRTSVTLLLHQFGDDSRQNSQRGLRAVAEIEQYNAVATVRGRWRASIVEAWTLLRRLSQNPVQLFVLTRSTRLVVAICSSFLYLLSPFDLVPEAVFGALGLLDDLAVMACALLFTAHMYRRLLVEG